MTQEMIKKMKIAFIIMSISLITLLISFLYSLVFGITTSCFCVMLFSLGIFISFTPPHEILVKYFEVRKQ